MCVFENYIWVNSPSEWTMKSTYFNGTLYVSMSIKLYKPKRLKHIRRSISITSVRDRCQDLCGLASDLVDEMKTEV